MTARNSHGKVWTTSVQGPCRYNLRSLSESQSSIGTPVSLRGIREVTDKNKHILLEAIFNGDFIPDHLLPVGIHRCGQQRWRAHLCTVGLKFSGPPRENVREACDDRRKFCEENGVNFVLYGKQTHAKGPIGSRPIVPSGFPRLSDYVASMSRSSTGGGSNSQAIIAGMRSNSAFKPFFDSIEDAKNVLRARKAESEGTASYVVTQAHASLHRRLVEESIDGTKHVFPGLKRKYEKQAKHEPFELCPIKISFKNLLIRFVWCVNYSCEDPALYAYIDSILCNINPPLPDQERLALARHLVESEVVPQVAHFIRLNEKYIELIEKHVTIDEGIKSIHQHAPHVVHTRKTHNAPLFSPGASPTDPVTEVTLSEGHTIKWNVFTPDFLAEEYSRNTENEEDMVAAGDLLFTILDACVNHRALLLMVQTAPAKKQTTAKPAGVGESHSYFEPSDIEKMENESSEYLEDHLTRCLQQIRSF